jgi:hypothetical protein
LSNGHYSPRLATDRVSCLDGFSRWIAGRLDCFRLVSLVARLGESAMYEMFLETWEEEGLALIPKTIGAIIPLVFTIWIELVRTILDWTIWF